MLGGIGDGERKRVALTGALAAEMSVESSDVEAPEAAETSPSSMADDIPGKEIKFFFFCLKTKSKL